jgi:putative NIF3 family GTP cyclohydrolase 1 type 2
MLAALPIAALLALQTTPPALDPRIDAKRITTLPEPTVATVADVVRELKRSSSAWVKAKASDLADFAWQAGYGVFSVGQSQVDDVRAYIAGQEEHHRRVSFQDEFRRLLGRYDIAFDERYVWD